jgi:hypothetical protein
MAASELVYFVRVSFAKRNQKLRAWHSLHKRGLFKVESRLITPAASHTTVSLCSFHLRLRIARKSSFLCCTSTRTSQVSCRISLDEANTEKSFLLRKELRNASRHLVESITQPSTSQARSETHQTASLWFKQKRPSVFVELDVECIAIPLDNQRRSTNLCSRATA